MQLNGDNGENLIEAIVDEMSRLVVPDRDWPAQDKVHGFFLERGYDCVRNVAVPYASETTGEIRQGRIAMMARDPNFRHPDIAVEIAASPPRSRSIQMLLNIEGVVRMLLIRGGSGPVDVPPEIHFVINLPRAGQVPTAGTVPEPRSGLSEKSRTVLTLIAEGCDYSQILALHPTLTHTDIFNAAGEALKIIDRGVRKPPSALPGTPQERARQLYERAYEPWEPNEEAQLQELVRVGKTTKEIAAILQRQPSVISSRLEKLARAQGPEQG